MSMVAFLEFSGLKLPCFAWFCIILQYFIRNGIVIFSILDISSRFGREFYVEERFFCPFLCINDKGRK